MVDRKEVSAKEFVRAIERQSGTQVNFMEVRCIHEVAGDFIRGGHAPTGAHRGADLE